MASRTNPLGNQSSKKPITIQLQVKSEQEIDYSSKKRKEINSASEKFCHEVDEQKSCPLCNRNLLVTATECNNPCDLCGKETEPKLKAGYGRMCDTGNPHDTSTVIPAVLDHQPAIIEHPEGLWRGNVVGQLEKEMFRAVEDRYPQTFQRLNSIPKHFQPSTLKQLHVFIKSFMQKSVHQLEEDELTSLEMDIDFFERIGFDLSWARNRVHMVRDLKFGNDPLRLELVETTSRIERARVEFEKAKVEYDKAAYVRNMKLHEMANKYGSDYDEVLNGKLGFGMLPGY